MSKAIFITNPIFASDAWGNNHPLAISRQRSLLDFCSALGWTSNQNMAICDFASLEQISKFHSEEYILAFQKASQELKIDAAGRAKFSLGTLENPLFDKVFERASASVGGSILAAEIALGGKVAFHPAGGTHHGRKDKASGFCYFNDPVFAILTLLDAGLNRVLYVDIDAHHGDGVEVAFKADKRVHMVSLHEENRWPNSGALKDNCAQICNLPLPKTTNDSEYAILIDAICEKYVGFDAQAIVIVAGGDCLKGDPLSTMALSNLGFVSAIEKLLKLAPVKIVLGGGGYNPWTVTRAWALVWGRLAGFEIPVTLPSSARDVLSGLECDLIVEEDIFHEWRDSIQDEGNVGEIRDEINILVGSLLKF